LSLAVLTLALDAAAATSSPHVIQARKAEKKGDNAAALSEYRAAMTDSASNDAALGVARNEEATGDLPRAYDDYQAFLSAPPTKATKAQTKEARTHAEKLAAATGTVTLSVKPEDAVVQVDGKDQGTAVAVHSVRLLPGSHVFGAHKPAFLPHEETVEVAAGTDRPLEVTLLPEPTTGRVKVRESQARAAELTIDGAVAGPLPWSGDLEAGPHKLEARGPGLHAAERTVDVQKGVELEVVMQGEATKGEFDLSIAGGQGLISLDGQVLGVGHYHGTAIIGPHEATFTREGFRPASRSFEVTEAGTAQVTATLAPLVVPPPPADHENGGVTTLLFAGSYQVNSAGSESEKNCAALGSGCNADPVVGGGLFLGFGHEWTHHLGFDIQLGFTADTGHRQFTDKNGDKEAYFVDRPGGIQSARFRYSLQSDNFRGTLAIGPGISERVPIIGSSTESDFTKSFKDASYYVSVGLNVDLSAQWRFTPSTALAVGAMLWIEDAGSDVVTSGFAGTQGDFRVVSGTQAVVYPYIGFVFGP
jgi:hypothetical protein